MKAKKIKTYTNDTDFLVVVYTNQAPNNEVFVVVEEDSCGIIKPDIRRYCCISDPVLSR